MTAGGIPVLAAESEEENTETTEQQSESGESGGGNTAVTLPAIGEDRPVVSLAPDDTADDDSENETDEPTQNDDNEPTETPEEPENPSKNELSTPDTSTAQNGSNSEVVELSEPQELPENFFQKVTIGQGYNQETGAIIPFDEEHAIKKDGSCVVRFDYEIPEGGMKAGQEYTFTVKAPLAMGVPFSIYNEKNEEVARGEVGRMVDGISQGTLTFKPEFSDYCTKPGTTGYFYVGTVFEKSDVGSGGRQDVSIEVTGGISTSTRVNFELSKVEPKLSLQKTGDSATYLSNHEIEWTLTADPSETGTDYITRLHIEDDLKDNGLIKTTADGETITDYVENSAVVTLYNGEKAQGTLTYENGKLSYTCEKTADSETVPGDLKKNAWPITITFRTRYNPEKLTPSSGKGSAGKVSFSNTAKASITAPQWTKDNDGKPELKDDPTNSTTQESSKTVDISYGSIWKDGWMVTGNRIHWIIKAKNSMLQQNPYIKDVLPAHLVLSGDITRKITDGEGNTIRNTKSDDYTFYKSKSQYREQSLHLLSLIDGTKLMELSFRLQFFESTE